MSKFTHLICDACWDRKYPDRPAGLTEAIEPNSPPCCFCGDKTESHIYLRAAPEATKCKGECSA